MRIRTVLLAVFVILLTAAPAAPPAAAGEPPGLGHGTVVEVGGVELSEFPPLRAEPQWFESEGADGELISTVVWESPAAEGWRVDASATVVRATHLREPGASYVWFRGWQARPSEEAVYRQVRLRGGRLAWLGRDQIIWQPARGSIASVILRDELASLRLLRQIAAAAVALGQGMSEVTGQ